MLQWSTWFYGFFLNFTLVLLSFNTFSHTCLRRMRRVNGQWQAVPRGTWPDGILSSRSLNSATWPIMAVPAAVLAVGVRRILYKRRHIRPPGSASAFTVITCICYSEPRRTVAAAAASFWTWLTNGIKAWADWYTSLYGIHQVALPGTKWHYATTGHKTGFSRNGN